MKFSIIIFISFFVFDFIVLPMDQSRSDSAQPKTLLTAGPKRHEQKKHHKLPQSLSTATSISTATSATSAIAAPSAITVAHDSAKTTSDVLSSISDDNVKRKSLYLNISQMPDIIEVRSLHASRSPSPSDVSLFLPEEFNPTGALTCNKLGLELQAEIRSLEQTDPKTQSVASLNKTIGLYCAAYDAFSSSYEQGYPAAYPQVVESYNQLDSYIKSIQRHYRLKQDPLERRALTFCKTQENYRRLLKILSMQKVPIPAQIRLIRSETNQFISGGSAQDDNMQASRAVYFHALALELFRKYLEMQTLLIPEIMALASRAFVGYKLSKGHPLAKVGLSALNRTLTLQNFLLPDDQRQFLEEKIKELSNGVGPSKLLQFTPRTKAAIAAQEEPTQIEQSLMLRLKGLGIIQYFSLPDPKNQVSENSGSSGSLSLQPHEKVTVSTYNQAEQLYKIKNWDEASKKFKEAYETEKNPLALLYLAEMHHHGRGEIKSEEKALEQLCAFIEQEPEEYDTKAHNVSALRILDLFVAISNSDQSNIDTKIKALCHQTSFMAKDKRIPRTAKFYKDLIALMNRAHSTLFGHSRDQSGKDWYKSGAALGIENLIMESGNYDLMFSRLTIGVKRFLNYGPSGLPTPLEDDIQSLLLFIQDIIVKQNGINQAISSVDSSIYNHLIDQIEILYKHPSLEKKIAIRYTMAYGLLCLLGYLNQISIGRNRFLLGIEVLHEAAKKGDPFAQFIYPIFCKNCKQHNTLIPTLSERKIIHYLQKAAENDNQSASFMLAELFSNDKKTKDKALAYADILLERRHPNARYLKAAILLKNPRASEEAQAKELLKQSIELRRKSLYSHANLAIMLMNEISRGQVIPTNIESCINELLLHLHYVIKTYQSKRYSNKNNAKKVCEFVKTNQMISLMEGVMQTIEQTNNSYWQARFIYYKAQVYFMLHTLDERLILPFNKAYECLTLVGQKNRFMNLCLDTEMLMYQDSGKHRTAINGNLQLAQKWLDDTSVHIGDQEKNYFIEITRYYQSL